MIYKTDCTEEEHRGDTAAKRRGTHHIHGEMKLSDGFLAVLPSLTHLGHGPLVRPLPQLCGQAPQTLVVAAGLHAVLKTLGNFGGLN